MSLGSKKVLLVDDNESLRITLAANLEDAGFEVVEAESLAAARRALGGSSFDVALLDVHLGDGRGPDLIPELAAARPRPAIAVLSGAEQDAGDGADAFIAKGAPVATLLAEIERLLKRGESR